MFAVSNMCVFIWIRKKKLKFRSVNGDTKTYISAPIPSSIHLYRHHYKHRCFFSPLNIMWHVAPPNLPEINIWVRGCGIFLVESAGKPVCRDLWLTWLLYTCHVKYLPFRVIHYVKWAFIIIIWFCLLGLYWGEVFLAES